MTIEFTETVKKSLHYFHGHPYTLIEGFSMPNDTKQKEAVTKLAEKSLTEQVFVRVLMGEAVKNYRSTLREKIQIIRKRTHAHYGTDQCESCAYNEALDDILTLIQETT